MPQAQPHQHEDLRLKALRNLNILDTPHEQAYDDIVQLAAELCGAPISLISLVDEDRQWFKAHFGLDVRETPRCEAFCAHAIHLPDEPLLVPDATLDARFNDNPLVHGEPRIRFYAGIPLVTAETRMPVGTLCVISDQRMIIDDRQLKALKTLASHVERLLQLREAHQQIAQRDRLIDASNDSIVSWTCDDGILSWNQGAEKLYGFNRGEAIGRKPWDLIQSYSTVRQYADGLAVGDDWVGEITHQTRTGRPAEVSTRIQRVAVEQRDVFLETSRDISEQKRRQRESRCAQAAIDTAADSVLWIQQGTGKILYVNESACQTLQYSKDELLSMNVSDIDPAVKSPEFMKDILAKASSPNSLLFQTTHLRKDGKKIPVEVASHIIQNGKESFDCSFVRDITDRVATQSELDEIRAEYQRIFDAIPLGVVTTDTQRRITRVNPAFEKMLGYSEEEVLGKSGEAIYADPEEFSTNGEEQQARLGAKSLAPREITLRRCNSETFVSQTIGTQVTNAAGEVTGFVGLLEDVSERVATRRELEKLNEERRAMLELLGTTDGIWSWQVGSDGCEYTPGLRKILGFAGDDEVSFPPTLQAFKDRIHPEDDEEFWQLVDRSLQQDKPLVHEFRMRHADGTYLWVRSRANSIQPDGDLPRRMIGSVYNITEFKIADSERERFFNAGIQHYGMADIGTATWIRVSDNWKEVLGFDGDELIGTPYLNLAHPDDRAQYIERMRELSDGNPVLGFLGRMRHKAGDYRLIEWNVAVPEPGTSIVCFTARDVTKADHEVLRKIADAVPMTLIVFDIKEQKMVFINQQVESLIGYSASEALEIGSHFMPKLAHPDDFPRIKHFFNEISHGKDDQRFETEYRLLHRNGDYRKVHSVWRAFKRSADGSVQQIIGTASLLDDLAILRQYANELEVANKELEEFAYVASHDLKQPLRGIDKLARWIETDAGGSLPAVVHQHLGRMRGRINRMDRLLDDLLAYSRIGRKSTTVEECDVSDIIREVSELLCPPETFRIFCPGPMPVMTTERIPLEQVFRNLIGNAIKHRLRDDGCAKISAKPVGPFVEFSVQDDGPGIAPEYHDRIFRMFHTLRPRDEVEASGMGLSLAKKQIESHGGKISVESSEGEGTVFRFTWPS